MRIQPPKDWDNDHMNIHQFKDYIRKHNVVAYEDGECITENVIDYFNSILPRYDHKIDAAFDFCEMFPDAYREIAKDVLLNAEYTKVDKWKRMFQKGPSDI